MEPIEPIEGETYSWKEHLAKVFIGLFTRKFAQAIIFGSLITWQFARLVTPTVDHWKWYIYGMLGLAGVLGFTNAFKRNEK